MLFFDNHIANIFELRSLEQEEENLSEKKILLGNEAIARGAYEAGVRVSAAYPGTPSTEISEAIAKYDEVYGEWSPNEKVDVSG